MADKQLDRRWADVDRRIAELQRKFGTKDLERRWRTMTPTERARANWQRYQREFSKELRDPAAFDKLPELCQRSIAEAKRGALGESSLRECERRALADGPRRSYATEVRR